MDKQFLVQEARPYEFPFSSSTTALIVVDMQNDFCDSEGWVGAMGYKNPLTGTVIKPIATIVEAARKNNLHIVWSRSGALPDLSDIPPNVVARWRRGTGVAKGDRLPRGRIMINNEWGWQIVPELESCRQPDDIVIDKSRSNIFFGTNLDSLLRYRGIKSLVYTGVCTDICVSSSYRASNDIGYENLIIEDACATFEQKVHDDTIYQLRMEGGYFGFVCTLDQFLKALD